MSEDGNYKMVRPEDVPGITPDEVEKIKAVGRYGKDKVLRDLTAKAIREGEPIYVRPDGSLLPQEPSEGGVKLTKTHLLGIGKV